MIKSNLLKPPEKGFPDFVRCETPGVFAMASGVYGDMN